MKVAILTTDNREHQRTYEEATPRFGPAIEALLQGLASMPELEVHVISCTQRPMQAPEKLSENTWFHLIHVPKIGWLRTGYQGCIRAVRHRLRSLRPDLVHGQGTERECALAAAFSGFPNIVTILGNMREVAKKVQARPGSYAWCAARLEGFALRRTAGVFCNSTYTEGLVRSTARRTWLVPNAVRHEFFAAPLLSVTKPTTPLILNVGAVISYKRQNELLEIAGHLHEKGSRFKLNFIGSASGHSSYCARFQHLMADATNQLFARHFSVQSSAELIASLDRASALVHVSTEESFGLVVAEALARNLKFFGTAAGGVTDIAAGVEGAELFPLGQESSLATSMSRWLEAGSPTPKGAAQEMQLRYHPDVIAQQHLEIYRDLVFPGGSNSPINSENG